MERVATSSPEIVDSRSGSRVNARVLLLAAFLGFLWFVLCRHLRIEWSANEQYNYGWFVPFFAAYLFWLRWEDKPEVGSQRSEVGRPSLGLGEGWRSAVRGRKSGTVTAIGIAMVALLILFPVRLFEIANPDWRPLGWIHAFAVITISFVVIYLAAGWTWVKHFSFPLLFFLVAVPWVTPIEVPIVQGLMRTIAALAAEAVSLLGIPAQVQGNIIRIASGVVGVNEACSGVRSLQTSLMIGLLFGELKRLTVWSRVVLVVGAIAIALVANLSRAVFLVWMASTREIAAVDRWHDFAGYTIVAIVFIGSLALAALLARRASKVESSKSKGESNDTKEAPRPDPLSLFPFRLSPFPFLLSIAWLFAVEAGVESWYRMHERVLIRTPQWTVLWPKTQPGFRNVEIDDRARGFLRYDTGGGAVWQINHSSHETGDAPSNNALNSLLYFFRWEPGRSSVLRARSHRPDICLPSTGWKQTADNGVRSYSTEAGIELPFRHFEFAQENNGDTRSRFAHTFFCIWQDRSKSGSGATVELMSETSGGWKVADRWQTVLNGERELGQQVIELVLTSPRRIGSKEAQQIFSDQIKNSVKPSPAL